MTVSVSKFSHDSDLIDQFSRQLCRELEHAVAARGHAYLVVSGGRTPVPLFERLSRQMLPWPQITILLADERWLPATDAQSNEGLVREHLLQHQAAAANFVSLLTDDSDAHQAVTKVSERLADLPRFDAVILGMGEDGHTASLFPCSTELEHALITDAPVAAVTPTTAPHQRMSLSYSRLLNSRHIYFHLSGTAKAATLEKVMRPEADFPASRFLQQQQVPVEVMLAVPEE